MNTIKQPNTEEASAQRHIVYHADPLCGWCFAIAKEVEAARHHLGDSIEWIVQMGGLVVGERIRPVALDAGYLRSGLSQVERASGRQASERYFENIVETGTWVSNSEPVCRAVLAAIEVAGQGAGMIATSLLSDLLYIEGLEPDSEESVGRVADAVGVSRSEFLALWRSDGLRSRLAHHWEQTRASGLTTYPTIAEVTVDGVRPLLTGYADRAVIIETLSV